MEKNSTQTVELDQFNRFDPNLWFNIVVFFGIILMLTASFLIFRGTKKNSKYSNDEYAEELDSDDEKNIDSATLMSSHASESKRVLSMNMVYVPPKLT